MADVHAEMLAGLQAAASGAFQPRFYRVRISPRQERRYRRPGMASRLSPAEARAVQAFAYFGGCSIHALARHFDRNRRTIRKALREPQFVAFSSAAEFAGQVPLDGPLPCGVTLDVLR